MQIVEDHYRHVYSCLFNDSMPKWLGQDMACLSGQNHPKKVYMVKVPDRKSLADEFFVMVHKTLI